MPRHSRWLRKSYVELKILDAEPDIEGFLHRGIPSEEVGQADTFLNWNEGGHDSARRRDPHPERFPSFRRGGRSAARGRAARRHAGGRARRAAVPHRAERLRQEHFAQHRGGLVAPSEGTVEIGEMRVRGPLPREVAYVFQEARCFPGAPWRKT